MHDVCSSNEIKVESITKLPQLKIELATDISRNESRPSETQVKSEQCDICEAQTAAVIFCIDCGIKSCKAHKEVIKFLITLLLH